MMILHTKNFDLYWLNTDLINTIIASFYAVTIAVYIYWKQQKDKYDSLKSSLINFLKKFKLDLKNHNFDSKLFVDMERESKNSFSRNVIISVIQSGLMNNHISDLLEYQSRIDKYYLFLDLSLDDLEDYSLEKEILEIENSDLSEITTNLISKLN